MCRTEHRGIASTGVKLDYMFISNSENKLLGLCCSISWATRQMFRSTEVKSAHTLFNNQNKTCIFLQNEKKKLGSHINKQTRCFKWCHSFDVGNVGEAHELSCTAALWRKRRANTVVHKGCVDTAWLIRRDHNGQRVHHRSACTASKQIWLSGGNYPANARW